MKDPKKILIIGVPHAEHEIYRQSLSDFHLCFSHSAAHAIGELKNNAHHVLLLDHRLPDATLPEFIQKLNQNHQLPIILILDTGQEKIAAIAHKIGITDYLTRDELIPAILGMSVNRAIESHRWKQIYQNMAQKSPALVLKDDVTGLFNKIYFETRLKEEASRSQRYEFPLTMAAFQVEGLDQISKKFGEKGVNQIFKELGQLLLRNLRSSDLLSRLGTNRFAVLLPHTTATEARSAWTRVLSNLTTHPFSVEEQNIFITVRGILMALNSAADDLDGLLSDMEKALQKMQSEDESLILYLPD